MLYMYISCTFFLSFFGHASFCNFVLAPTQNLASSPAVCHHKLEVYNSTGITHVCQHTTQRGGCGALVECLTTSPVMQASRARASLILLRYFRVLGLLLVVVPFTPPGEVIRDLLRLLHAVRMVWKH